MTKIFRVIFLVFSAWLFFSFLCDFFLWKVSLYMQFELGKYGRFKLSNTHNVVVTKLLEREERRRDVNWSDRCILAIFDGWWRAIVDILPCCKDEAWWLVFWGWYMYFFWWLMKVKGRSFSEILVEGDHFKSKFVIKKN